MKHGLRLICAVMLGWLLTGCTEQAFTMLESVAVDGCPAFKIRFTQATGCQNDGSFEFCLADDPVLITEIMQMSPNITCGPGRGRAQCDTETEVLCMVSTDGLCLPPSHGPINDAGWQLACDLAAHPAIFQLVPTWYE
jgi:hypothetical protein